MDYSKTAQKVMARIAELKNLKEQLCSIEERVVAIENEICAIDESLPSDEELSRMLPGETRRRIMEVIDLDEEAFSVIDDILGPAGEGMEDAHQENVFSPEARGVRSISLEDALAKLTPSGKNNAS